MHPAFNSIHKISLFFFLGLKIALLLRFICLQTFAFGLPRQAATQSRHLQDDDLQRQFKYAAIVDCGSSGTRAQIYRWIPSATSSADARKIAQDTQLEALADKKISPGLSEFSTKSADAVGDYIEPLLEFIANSVPLKAVNETLLEFMGTAGMRFLSRREQQELFGKVRTRVNQRYPQFSNKMRARMIRGANEGLYQWLSVNKFSQKLSSSGKHQQTVGIIEMGGGSVQVSFELKPQLELFLAGRLKLVREAYDTFSHMREAPHSTSFRQIFSVSFPGLGSNSARNLLVDLLVRDHLKLPRRQSPSQFLSVRRLTTSTNSKFYNSPKQQPPELVVRDPCLPPGASETRDKPVELHSIVDQPSVDYQLKVASFRVRLEGAGSFAACYMLAKRALWVARSNRLNCSLGAHQALDGLNFDTNSNDDNDEDDDDDEKEEKASSVDDPEQNPFMIQQQNQQQCPISLLHTFFVPFKLIPFVGLGDLYWTTNKTSYLGAYKSTLIAARAQRICSQQHDTRSLQGQSKVPMLECFKASYMLAFLHEGLKMPSAMAQNHFYTTNSIDGHEVTWTEGALLETLAAEEERHKAQN